VTANAFDFVEGATGGAATRVVGEPKSATALRAGLLAQDGITVDGRIQSYAIPMRDDGTNGDVKANDGIYTARFADSIREGTYAFRFTATGVTGDGVTFDQFLNVLEESLESYGVHGYGIEIVRPRAADARTLAETIRAQLERVESHYAALFESSIDLGGNRALVFTGTDDDPETLATLAEMRYYRERGLADDTQLLLAYQTLLGQADGTVLILGTAEQRERLLKPWLPAPPVAAARALRTTAADDD